MSGNSRLLLDTNAVLYLLGASSPCEFLEGKEIYISFVTELELLSYPSLTASEEQNINFFLAKCRTIDLARKIKDNAIKLKKAHSIKLPDAIIAATALCEGLVLVTNDKKLLQLREIKTQRFSG
ncbi:MAG: type II toxin-antitoxin system VapC family toxin [Candidatus Margulisiibacteriota bacterium]|jgi:hypothetical protein